MVRWTAGPCGLAAIVAGSACQDPTAAVDEPTGSTTGAAPPTDRPEPTEGSTRGPSTSGSTTGGARASTTADDPIPDLPVLDVAVDGEGRTCSSDLTTVVDAQTGAIVETCDPAEGCLDGECVDACLAAGHARGSMGCAFLVPTTPFYANGNPGAVQSGPCHALLVANPWARDAQLTLSRDGVLLDVLAVGRIPQGIADTTTYDPLPMTGLPSEQVAVVFLSHRPGVHNGLSLECPIEPAVLADTAVHGSDDGVAFSLTSDTPIQVYDILPYGGAPTFLPAASLIVPTSAWGDAYVIASPHEPDGTAWISAVAQHDGTTIAIEPAVPMLPGTIPTPSPGVATPYLLDAGEVIQWHASTDPVGSILTADQPIGVFAGNTYLRVTTQDDPASGRDCAHQQLPAADALGREYVGPGLYSRLLGLEPESVRYRIVGVADDTVLHWDPAPPDEAPLELSAGEAVEFESREPFTVWADDASTPFSLAQYMSGTLDGQPGCTGYVGPCPLGDDDWVVLVPPRQFLRAYTFFVDPTYATTTLVLVRTAGPTGGFHDVTLSCMGTVTGWMPVGDEGRYEVAHVELFRGGVASVPACATSQHSAASDGDFGVLVWGIDVAASYGYPAGGLVQTINQIDLDPPR